MADFCETLRRVCRENGVERFLDERTEPLFLSLADQLKKKNAEMNLTAITDDEGIAAKHFADCLLLCDMLPASGKAADIGCGGGFPALPMAIACPGICVTAIDSTAKKIAYVGETAALLGLDGFRAVSMRAEDGAHAAAYREVFDIVTARAVASLNVLCELCLPYVRVGGSFFSMKGKGADEELAAASEGIRRLGGKVCHTEKKTLILADGTEEERCVIEIRKTASTPEKYPRPYAQIKKKPL